jgi:hypothetical protein
VPKAEFPYFSQIAKGNAAFPQGWACRRPQIAVSLIHGAKRLSTFGLLDTGADHCLFPESFMAALGIDPGSTLSQSTMGVGGVSLTYFREVTIEVPRFAAISAYVGFSVGMEPWGIGLLGHRGFLDRFKVTFQPKHFEIETI